MVWAVLVGTSPLAFAQSPSPAATAAPPKPPVVLQAQSLQGVPDGQTQAQGDVRLGQGALRMEAPQLRFDAAGGVVFIEGGGVRWARQRDRLQSESGVFEIDRSVGEFRSPFFFFGQSMAGGSGSTLRMLDAQRVEIRDARLTSCLADEAGRPLREAGARPGVTRAPASLAPLSDQPAAALAQLSAAPRLEAPPRADTAPGWELRSPRILLDFEREEGVAEQAQLQFLGLPIMALPRLSFPLGDARRSGWLPPTARADTRSGFEVSAPYYLNLAPHYDATVTPIVATRRGPSVELEFRQMGPAQAGLVQLHHLPQDQVLERSRSALYWQQQWRAAGMQFRTEGLRVSDDDYWKDFAHTQTFQRRSFSVLDVAEGLNAERTQANLQPRLLAQSAQAERPWQWGGVSGLAYARVQQWQVLQGTDPNGAFIAPYQRSPQMGVTAQAQAWGGVDLALETEANRFTRPDMAIDLAPQLRNGQRWHALATVSRPWIAAAGWVIPKLTLNTASYRLDTATGPAAGAAAAGEVFSRTIPTLSVDGGLNFEQRWRLGDRSLVQTLEPRVVYVNTPMRDQRNLPNFDAAPKEFNSTSIFSENAFSGIDRVSDAHQVTLGMTTRSLDAATGAEWIRGSIAQRVQLRDQTTTPAGGVANQRLSDVLLAATVGAQSRWGVDSTVQYSPDLGRTTRSVLTLRYQPALNTTLLASYRYARDLAETVEVRANWPLYRRLSTASGGAGQDCTMLVTGATRLNYNTREGKLADSLLGLEGDAGCWIMRLGVQRQSTGVTEVVTRLIFQLELSGLTRSRANPLRF
ncbi:MAG: hypothetical protein RI972_713 [Pseudomonadota bacterium]